MTCGCRRSRRAARTSSGAPPAATRKRAARCRRERDRRVADRRQRHGAARVSRRRRRLRHQGPRRPRPGAGGVATRRPARPRSSRPTRRRRRRSSCRASTWSARAGGARVVVEQRLRQRLHRSPTASSDAQAMTAAPPRRVGCDAERGARRVDRRHRREARHGQGRAGITAAAGRSARDGGAAAARAIMTTDPFPKERPCAVIERARHLPRRRHRQGLRHDRADDWRRCSGS